MADDLSVEQLWNEEASKMDPDTNPAPPEPPPPSPEPTPDPEPVDPYAGLHPEVKKKLSKVDDLLKANEDLKNHVRAAEGRVAAWQREREQIKQQQQTAVATPTSAEVASAKADPEKWTQLKEDFPEWAEAMEEYIATKVAPSQPSVSADDLNRLIEERTGQLRQETLEAVEYAKLEARHDDWREVVGTQQFADWIRTQPVDVYNLVHSPKAADAVKMLDLYKATLTPSPVERIKSQRKETLSNAVSTKPGVSRQSKTVDSMTPEELWTYEAKLREKRLAQQGY
jgi:DNA-directed RNA polymerase subunit F